MPLLTSLIVSDIFVGKPFPSRGYTRGGASRMLYSEGLIVTKSSFLQTLGLLLSKSIFLGFVRLPSAALIDVGRTLHARD
jgi:hypothetical protein